MFRIILFEVYVLVRLMASQEPCNTQNEITEWERSVFYNKTLVLCDAYLNEGWYRVTLPGGQMMPTFCPPDGNIRCGTHWGYWLSSKNTTYEESLYPTNGTTVSRIACRARNTFGICCDREIEIKIKDCGCYYVYYLKPTSYCWIAYCFGDKLPHQWTNSSDDLLPGCNNTD